MPRARVYELAKALGVDSKTVLEKLKDMGEFVKSASSTVEAPVVRKLKAAFPQQDPGAAKGGAPKSGAPKPAQPRKPQQSHQPVPGPSQQRAEREPERGESRRTAPVRPAAPDRKSVV